MGRAQLQDNRKKYLSHGAHVPTNRISNAIRTASAEDWWRYHAHKPKGPSRIAEPVGHARGSKLNANFSSARINKLDSRMLGEKDEGTRLPVWLSTNHPSLRGEEADES